MFVASRKMCSGALIRLLSPSPVVRCAGQDELGDASALADLRDEHWALKRRAARKSPELDEKAGRHRVRRILVSELCREERRFAVDFCGGSMVARSL